MATGSTGAHSHLWLILKSNKGVTSHVLWHMSYDATVYRPYGTPHICKNTVKTPVTTNPEYPATHKLHCSDFCTDMLYSHFLCLSCIDTITKEFYWWVHTMKTITKNIASTVWFRVLALQKEKAFSHNINHTNLIFKPTTARVLHLSTRQNIYCNSAAFLNRSEHLLQEWCSLVFIRISNIKECR